MGLLIAIALVLSYFERFIPLAFVMPGLKLGLANIVSLVALLFFGWVEVLIIVLLRVTMMTFFTGSMISFFYSLTGSLFSLIAMSLMLRFFMKYFSLVGVSVLGAAAHNTGQMVVLSIITGSLRVGMQWMPYLLLAGLITGLITGTMAYHFHQHWISLKTGIPLKQFEQKSHDF